MAIKVCYILSYRDPAYIRTRTLINALNAIKDVRLFLAVNTANGMRRYLQTLLAVLKIKRKNQPHCYIIGFRGHEIFWLIRLVAGKRPLFFDALMSPYASLREERKHGKLGALLGIPCRWAERSILHNADRVFTDTRLHKMFYEKEFRLPADKLTPLPVGAIESAATEYPDTVKTETDFFTVLFYGSFLPLHGIDVILRAAARLKDLPIRFDFIGGSERRIAHFHRLRIRLGIRLWTHCKWIAFDDLIHKKIPLADVCLGGPFGNTPQARRVVTGKTSQCLALGKATVIGRIDEDHGFVDKENCLLVNQGDDIGLASTLRWAHLNRDKLATIGKQGYELYHRRLSVRVVQETLEKCLKQMSMET